MTPPTSACSRTFWTAVFGSMLALIAGCGFGPPSSERPSPPKTVTGGPATEVVKKDDSKKDGAPADPHKDEAPKKDAPKSELGVLGSPVLDGFEGPEKTVWAFDSADDEGLATFVAEGKTQGEKALKVTIREKAKKGKFHLRWDVGLNLSHATSLIVDVTSPADKLSVALALKSHPNDVYQESKPVNLKKGLNRDVRFSLTEKTWKNEKSKWEHNGPPVNLNGVRRVMILLFPNEESKGDFLLDNLRVEGVDVDPLHPIDTVFREWRPEFVRAPLNPTGATQYETLEMPAVVSASYEDIFDPSDMTYGVRITTPSGKNQEVRGFFSGISHDDARTLAGLQQPAWGPMKSGVKRKVKDKPTPEELAEEKAERQFLDGAAPVWRLRFAPQETGRYTLQFYARNDVGETRLPDQYLVVTPQSSAGAPLGRKGGNVRVSKRDPRHLELQDGSPFFIFGQNVCWTQNWTPYLEKIRDYGGNTCRIWLCPWGMALEKKSEPGDYDLNEAARLDKLMADAERTGVRIIFCFTFHGMTDGMWGDSPYNLANGGPCARRQEFFSNWRAKNQFKRLLSYACARWGSSPALLSWELINEADLAGFDSPEDVASWSREMAGHLKGNDPHGHIVTTSTTNTRFLPELWHDSRIDFISVHGYGTAVQDVITNQIAPFTAIAKPVLLAEFGGGTEPEDDIPDKNGARLKTALWLTACSPNCGLALPWWWDTYIETRGLYPLFTAAGKFIAGEDRRGRYGNWVRKSFENGVEASGIMDGQGARLYIHHPEWTRRPETRGTQIIREAIPLTLTGIIDGAYRVEFWDATTGQVFDTKDAAAKEGALTIQLPARESEFAIKIDRKEPVRQGLK